MNGVVNAVTGRGKDVQRDDNAPVETENVEQTQMQDPNVRNTDLIPNRILVLCNVWTLIVV